MKEETLRTEKRSLVLEKGACTGGFRSACEITSGEKQQDALDFEKDKDHVNQSSDQSAQPEHLRCQLGLR